MRGTNKVLPGVTHSPCTVTMTACSSSAKKPVGQFKTLSGNTTTVVLDPGFLTALTCLKLTPGVFGTAKLQRRQQHRCRLPDHRRQRHDLQEGQRQALRPGRGRPRRQWALASLPADHVTMKNFVVHPGNNSNLTGEST